MRDLSEIKDPVLREKVSTIMENPSGNVAVSNNFCPSTKCTSKC